MIVKQGNDRGQEYVWAPIHNVDGAGSLTQNMAVCYVVNGSSITGPHAMIPAAVNFKNFAGVMNATVAINGWGLSTIWGNANSCLISNEGTSISILAGDALIPVNVAGMSSVGGATQDWLNQKYVIITQTLGVSAAVTADNVVVRAI